MRKIVFLGLCSIAAATPVVSLAQDTPPAAKASPYTSTIGAVTEINPAEKKIVIKTDAGASVTIPMDEKTHFLKIAPGEKDVKKATESKVEELKTGDRISARNRKLDDGALGPATTVLVMTKEELAQHQEKTQLDWQQNGLQGTVTVVNPATKEVTIKLLGADPKMVVIEPADKVDVRRYSEDSVQFADAKPSAVSEIHTGDTVRVLGKKSEDGTRVKPDEIVYGTFAVKAGTILSIDAAANTITVKDLITKKPLVVKINSSTVIKKIPEQMAQGLARMQQAKLAGGAAGRGGAGAGAGAGRGGDSGGGRGPGGGGMRLDPAHAVERSPVITLADLKNGDALMINTSVGQDPSKVTAITLIAGVEPLLTAPAARNGQDPSSGSWGIDIPGIGQ
jgi:Cu/Ag efflux protein CusF